MVHGLGQAGLVLAGGCPVGNTKITGKYRVHRRVPYLLSQFPS